MSQPPLRRAELVATLSIATDLGTGHPMERALRACLLALRIAEALGCNEATLADCYYVALLRYAGCAADARHRAALFSDELALGPEIDMVELCQVAPMLASLHTHHARSTGPFLAARPSAAGWWCPASSCSASTRARSPSSGASTPMCRCWGNSACCRRFSR
jgi:hypothetical protein